MVLIFGLRKEIAENARNHDSKSSHSGSTRYYSGVRFSSKFRFLPFFCFFPVFWGFFPEFSFPRWLGLLGPRAQVGCAINTAA